MLEVESWRLSFWGLFLLNQSPDLPEAGLVNDHPSESFRQRLPEIL